MGCAVHLDPSHRSDTVCDCGRAMQNLCVTQDTVWSASTDAVPGGAGGGFGGGVAVGTVKGAALARPAGSACPLRTHAARHTESTRQHVSLRRRFIVVTAFPVPDPVRTAAARAVSRDNAITRIMPGILSL